MPQMNSSAHHIENPDIVLQPRPRVFYNDDGDRGVMVLKGPFHPRQLHDPVDLLLGTSVTTLVYCAYFGSDQAYYPTKVGSALDWRETPAHRVPGSIFQRVYQVGKLLREQGIDLLGTVMARAKEKGLEFIPSLRMNDIHFAQKIDPRENPATGQFWMEHQEMILAPGRPWDPDEWPLHTLDFTHEAVREYRMGQIRELIDGYAEDGFEMDFTRSHFLFPRGKAKPELVNDMVRKTRTYLDARAQRVGKPLPLIIRTAPTLAMGMELGLDAATWIREGLADYVVPSSPFRHMSFDIPIDEFLALARGTKTRICAGPDSASIVDNGHTSGDMYRAVMSNYYAMGQHDTYLFNFFCRNYPYNDEDYAILRDIADPDTLYGRPKRFMAAHYFHVTPPEYYQYSEPWGHATIPQMIEGIGKPVQVDIYVGDDLDRARAEHILEQALLRVRIQGFRDGDPLEIRWNGRLLPLTDARIEYPDYDAFCKSFPWPGGWDQVVNEGPFAYLSFDVSQLPALVGYNTVTVTQTAPRNDDGKLKITLADLLTRYNVRGVE